MRWDRVIACVLIILGIGYASYSYVMYLQKVEVVEKITPSEASKLADQKSKSLTSVPVQPVIVPKVQRPKQGEKFAYLYIPRLKERLPVIEGTNDEQLAYGVGHYERSVLPGEGDNAVLSGHRDTVLQRLGELNKGDTLQVVTPQGSFVYRITKTWVTDASDQSVIVSHKLPILTLTTCYPFGYIGSAPDRYIVQAKLVAKF
ncbi:sortase A [Seinonella peptonophila]|uniref:Sortase A n=1 Tax=Seinonella peptonophila TaxID=112248 RepID=A0A1M4WM04_9BACL|nr:class D sortase [Seinonella peptonophila]SHE82227.1 sortase A [Seinonella peptonophila]